MEQLYLTGLHLEQYRHATWSALDYYEEAMRRDPLDVRCNNQLGVWYLRRGRFEKAEPYLRTAVKVLMKRNPNPYWGEPLYNLGLCLKYQNQYAEAYDWFYKATWNGAWQGAAYFACAQISSAQGCWEDALYEVNRALVAGYHNQKARALKAALLANMKREDDLAELMAESLRQDRFNYGILFEAGETDHLVALMHGNPLNYHELALDYAQAGMRSRATAVLDLAIKVGAVNAMTYYYKTWLNGEECRLPEASLPICFPNRLEDILALQRVMVLNKKDAQAPYLLGCLYYDKRQYDLAMEYWELSARLDPQFPTVWRNLALVTFNKGLTPNMVGEGSKEALAVEYMERAFHLDENDERVLMELDQLYKRLHRPHTERLAFLQKYPQLIHRRDDLVLEEITLLNQVGRYEEAMQKLDAHTFHPWEGGEGKVSAQYQICRVELAKKSLTPAPILRSVEVTKGRAPEQSSPTSSLSPKGEGSDYLRAIKLLQQCLTYPHHLGEGKLYGAQENDFYYLLGIAYEQLGNDKEARRCFEEGTAGPTEPAAAMYYNDAKPDKIFYAALCYRKLGQENKARGLFNKLISYGKQHIYDKVVMDYFAVSLPDLLIWDDSLDTKNLVHCKYMLALGYYGIGNREKALQYLAEVEALDNNHQGIQQFRSFINCR